MSFLTQLQQQCADCLQADPLFAHVPVLTERIADISGEIDRALGPLNSRAGKTGIVAILLTPSANANFENVFGPFFDEINIAVRIVENVPVNQDPATGTNVSAAALAERTCALLHHFQPENATGPVVARKPTLALGNDPQHLSYDCLFQTSGGIASLLPQIDTPIFTNNAGLVSIHCDTPGAAIFYTLDGANASPRAGTLYTNSFTPGPGVTVKARAWLAGFLTSETASITL